MLRRHNAQWREEIDISNRPVGPEPNPERSTGNVFWRIETESFFTDVAISMIDSMVVEIWQGDGRARKNRYNFFGR